jgi:hypothetical protein
VAITPDQAAFVFGPWAADDTIVGPAHVTYLDEDGDPADLSGTILSNGRLTDPAGLHAEAPASLSGAILSAIDYQLPGAPFLIAGVWQLDVQLQVDGNLFRTAPATFVVEAGDGWATIAAARAGWRDAPAADATLWRLLDVARQQVIEWAPADAFAVPGSRPAAHLVTAQLTQARNVWNAVKTDPASQGIGDEGFVIRPFPMDWTVKNMIRPPRAKPVVK